MSAFSCVSTSLYTYLDIYISITHKKAIKVGIEKVVEMVGHLAKAETKHR